MPYWIGVVGSRDAVERLRTEAETWWCVPKTAATGDQLAVYVARSRLKDLPEDQGGIVSIFEIAGPQPEREADCRRFGGGYGAKTLAPVKIIVKERFQISLKLAEMKLDSRLSGAQFVRRSFQGTCFPASPVQFRRIRDLLATKQGFGEQRNRKPR